MCVFSLFKFFPENTVGSDRRSYTATYRLNSVLHMKPWLSAPNQVKLDPIFYRNFQNIGTNIKKQYNFTLVLF